MTQSALGEILGITFQQVQKYENGTNRISALTLLKISSALDVAVAELLQDLEDNGSLESKPTPGLRQLTATFSKIKSPHHRELVLKLTEALAGQGERSET